MCENSQHLICHIIPNVMKLEVAELWLIKSVSGTGINLSAS